jgi:4-hydroxy-tetrahydrodipicolinate synthase
MIAIQGTYTALITPFRKDGAVDWEKLAELVERQVAGGVAGVVPVGTTGESPTLTMEEHAKVIEKTIEYAAGRLQVVAGAGANSTAEAIHLTKEAIAMGADATLQVTPYYNKPNAAGLLAHFSAVADLGKPVVLYNIPGRTGREIPLPVVEALAKHPNIAAIKEAGGSVDRVSRIRQMCDLPVLSGDDALTLPMMSVGAVGVVSVASNVTPEKVCEMVNFALEGKYAEARACHEKLYPLFRDLFCDTNPIPVKVAMELIGFAPAVYRLPLCAPDEACVGKVRSALAAVGIL